MGGGRDVELQNPKRPTDYRDCGTSPFFEGDRSLKQNTKKGDVCAANNHRQKNGGLERTYKILMYDSYGFHNGFWIPRILG